MNIQTQNNQRPVNLPRFRRKIKYNMLDVSKAVCVAAYMESLLDDLDRLLEMKINDKVKQGVRKMLSRHDHAASAYFGKEDCLAMSNILTRNIDTYRAKTYNKISKKQLDNNHFVLFLTYELNEIKNVLDSLFDVGSVVYSNTIKGLINALNLWLSKQDFTDKLNIHSKRKMIGNTINGFIQEALIIFNEEAQRHE
jgi:ABC-type Na+ transport system ATPase subunit NatA